MITASVMKGLSTYVDFVKPYFHGTCLCAMRPLLIWMGWLILSNIKFGPSLSFYLLQWKSSEDDGKCFTFLRYLHFCPDFLEKRLDKKAMINFKIYDVTDWTINNYNTLPNISLYKKMKFSIKDFFSKCDQIRRKLRIWSQLLKKSLMENFSFFLCSVLGSKDKLDNEICLVNEI